MVMDFISDLMLIAADQEVATTLARGLTETQPLNEVASMGTVER